MRWAATDPPIYPDAPVQKIFISIPQWSCRAAICQHTQNPAVAMKPTMAGASRT
jgi:hypothetical protein